MTFEELEQLVRKIDYQLRIISDTIDREQYPIESLILSLDWSEGVIDRVHDIFEEFDEKINKGENIVWMELENRLKNEFNIGYQTVKQIVLAFYRNQQWVHVCRSFAESFKPNPPAEFWGIINDPDYKEKE